jgi:hypothetical protein
MWSAPPLISSELVPDRQSQLATSTSVIGDTTLTQSDVRSTGLAEHQLHAAPGDETGSTVTVSAGVWCLPLPALATSGAAAVTR